MGHSRPVTGLLYLYINTLRGQKAEFVYLKESGVFVFMDMPLVFSFNFVTAYCLLSGNFKYLCCIFGKSSAEPEICENQAFDRHVV